MAEHGGTRLRHQVQPKFCPGSQAQCVQNVNKVTFQLKCCIGKRWGRGQISVFGGSARLTACALCNGACMIGLGRLQRRLQQKKVAGSSGSMQPRRPTRRSDSRVCPTTLSDSPPAQVFGLNWLPGSVPRGRPVCKDACGWRTVALHGPSPNGRPSCIRRLTAPDGGCQC